MNRSDLTPQYGLGAPAKHAEDVIADFLNRIAASRDEMKIDMKFEVHEHKYFFFDPAQAAPYTLHLEKSMRSDYNKVLHPQPNVPTSGMMPTDIDKWRGEVSEFERQRQEFWANPLYRNKHVALLRGRVVDMDADKFSLARRIRKAYPDEVVLIARVQIGKHVVRVPSPRLKR